MPPTIPLLRLIRKRLATYAFTVLRSVDSQERGYGLISCKVIWAAYCKIINEDEKGGVKWKTP
jgi:hypothetical protein